MTGHEIRKMAETLIGTAITDTQTLSAINEAMIRIGDLGLIYGEITVPNAMPGQWYHLPNDAIHVRGVVDEKNNPVDWSLLGNSIQFHTGGNLTIKARKLAKKFEDVSEEPDIHPAFHGLLVNYLRAIVTKQLDLGLFEQEARRISLMLRRSRQPRTIEVVR